jgi:hypothetical protein
LDEDLSGSARIAADSFNSFGADKAYADSGSQAAEGALNAACYAGAGNLSEDGGHSGGYCWLDFRRPHT